MSEDSSIVLVGHCGPDLFLLKSTVARHVPDVPIVAVNDHGTLEAHLSARSLLLINRVLDGSFDTDSGVSLIARLSAREDRPATMLISNFQDAQQEAVAAGAFPGFGKSQLYDDSTSERLRDALAGRRDETPIK